MVDSIGSTKGQVGEVCCCGSKRGRKDDGIDVLVRQRLIAVVSRSGLGGGRAL